MLQKFNIGSNAKTVTVQLAPHFNLLAMMSPKSVNEREYTTHVPYANIVDSFMYDMVCTMADLSQAMSMISRYKHDPGKGHWEAIKWILRYIKGTGDMRLVFENDDHGKLECK